MTNREKEAYLHVEKKLQVAIDSIDEAVFSINQVFNTPQHSKNRTNLAKAKTIVKNILQTDYDTLAVRNKHKLV